MRKLETQLKEWTQQGLIHKDQADGIAQYEATQPNSSWMLYGFIALGSTVVGIGMISLVAANWAEIPDMAKLGGALLLLLTLAGGILHTQGRGDRPLLETQLALFMLSCMATLGLIEQIYHSDHTLEDALLFWSVVTFSVAMLSQQPFLPFLWTSICLIASTLKFWDYVVHLAPTEESLLVGLLMAIPFFCAILSAWMAKPPILTPFAAAFHHWTFISAGLGIIVTDLWSLFRFQPTQETVVFLPAIFLSLLSIVTLIRHKNLSRTQKKWLFAAIVLYLAMFPVCLQYAPWPSTGAIFAILIVGLAAVFVGLQNRQRLFTVLTLLIGLRFLVVYFSAIGGLALTGFGLIFSGILILGIVAFWHRNNRRLQQWIMGLEK